MNKIPIKLTMHRKCESFRYGRRYIIRGCKYMQNMSVEHTQNETEIDRDYFQV